MMDELFGVLESITFQNEENGFTVAKIKVPRMKDPVSVVGTMVAIQPGETLRCQGSWQRHLVHGQQFVISTFRTEKPADIVGIRKYLGSGLVRGIGPVYAERIVAAFGIETLHVIDKDPDRLAAIPGIGPKRLSQLKACWDEQKVIREVMIFLQKHSISPTFAGRIFKTYGDKSIDVIQENPFLLARDIRGIGFKSADLIAEKIGIPKDSPQRIDAGIEYILNEFSTQGHVCYPKEEFIKQAATLFLVEPPLIAERLSALREQDRIREAALGTEGIFLYLKTLFIAEIGIAKELRRLKNGKSPLRLVDGAKAITWVEELLKIELADKQTSAVKTSLTEKVQIITGGPGTGKSTITNAILKITEKLTQKITLAAPTGRAAKRMTEITGRHAQTIHSLLEVDFKNGGFKRNRQNPLECDLIIVDEASMIDTPLMYNLLKAIPDSARLILIGDVNQLPSVGPGTVLKNLLDSGTIKSTELTEIYRQAAGSAIITNAHKIQRGFFPEIKATNESDFFFIQADEPEECLKVIVELVADRLPKKYGFHPVNDIQVLTPMRKGVIGAENLNVVLQEKINPHGEPLFRMGRKYLPNDKVMQIRNNYQKEVYNGDVGTIRSIHTIDQELIVDFDDREVHFDFTDLDELVLAYAASIHKSQGSEFPCVVIPVHTTHFKMLHKNLLYTGVTRGKKLVVLVGTVKALAIAVKTDDVNVRNTGLKEALWGKIDQNV